MRVNSPAPCYGRYKAYDDRARNLLLRGVVSSTPVPYNDINLQRQTSVVPAVPHTWVGAVRTSPNMIVYSKRNTYS